MSTLSPITNILKQFWPVQIELRSAFSEPVLVDGTGADVGPAIRIRSRSYRADCATKTQHKA